MKFEMSLEQMLNLNEEELKEIAIGYNKIWNGKITITPNTIDNTVAGILAELAVARKLIAMGATELKLYGMDGFISTAKYSESIQHHTKADIECIFNGSEYKVEVKSGFPKRYPHRQFTLHDVDKKWAASNVDVVVWVDIIDDKVSRIHPFPLAKIRELPVKKNFRGVACYTYSGGY